MLLSITMICCLNTSQPESKEWLLLENLYIQLQLSSFDSHFYNPHIPSWLPFSFCFYVSVSNGSQYCFLGLYKVYWDNNLIEYDRQSFSIRHRRTVILLLSIDPNWPFNHQSREWGSLQGHHLSLPYSQRYVSAHSGQQKFDETKAPIEAKFEQTNGDLPVMAFNNSRLNFYLPTYTRGRKQDFTLRLIQH